MKYAKIIIIQCIIVLDVFARAYFERTQGVLNDTFLYQYIYYFAVYTCFGLLLVLSKGIGKTSNIAEKAVLLSAIAINIIIIAAHFIGRFNLSFLAIIMIGYSIGELIQEFCKKSIQQNIN